MQPFDYEQALFGERGQFFRNEKNLGGVRLERSLQALSRIDLEHQHVLEVGCGAGVFSRSLKYYLPQARLRGCDLSRRAALVAARHSSGIDFDVADAQALPYRDETFQAVVFFDLLEHVPDPLQTLCEFQRVLRPGGILHGYVPCEGNTSTLHWFMRKLNVGARLTRKHAGHVNYFSVADVATLMDRARLQSVEQSYSSQFLGQALDVAIFVAREMVDRSKRSRTEQAAAGPAEFYNRDSVQSVGLRRAYGPLRRGVDFVVALEARELRRVRVGLGLHITAQKAAALPPR